MAANDMLRQPSVHDDPLRQPSGYSNFRTQEAALAWLEAQMPVLDFTRLDHPRLVGTLTTRQMDVARAIYSCSAKQVKMVCLGQPGSGGYGSRPPSEYDALVNEYLMRVHYGALWRFIELQQSTIAAHVLRIEEALDDCGLGRTFLWIRGYREQQVCPTWPVLAQKALNAQESRSAYAAWRNKILDRLKGNTCLSFSVHPTSGTWSKPELEQEYELQATFHGAPDRETVEVLCDVIEGRFVSPAQTDPDGAFCWGKAVISANANTQEEV